MINLENAIKDNDRIRIKNYLSKNKNTDNESWLIYYFNHITNLISNNNYEIFEIFIDNFNFTKKYLYNIIKFVCQQNNIDYLKKILNNYKNVDYNECLNLTITYNKNIDFVKYLIDKGADINYDTGNILANACSLCDVDFIKTLVYLGADVSLNNYDPLYRAIIRHNLDLVCFLLSTDIKNKSKEQLNYMLSYTIDYGDYDMSFLLLEYGFDIKKLNQNSKYVKKFSELNRLIKINKLK